MTTTAHFYSTIAVYLTLYYFAIYNRSRLWYNYLVLKKIKLHAVLRQNGADHAIRISFFNSFSLCHVKYIWQIIYKAQRFLQVLGDVL